jgi:hypothetical protein
VPGAPCGKIKFKKVACFLRQLKDHQPTTFHHEFTTITIKKPRSTPHFFQNPPQKPSKNNKKRPPALANIFPENQGFF